MTKLSDTQLLLLSKASQRADHAIERPATLKGGAADKVVASLIRRGYAAESAALAGMPEWRRDEEAGSIALVVTAAGLDAIGVAIETDTRTDFDVERDAPWGEEGCIRDDPNATPQQMDFGSGLSPNAPRPGTKLAQAVDRLQRPEGATLDDLVQATGWLPHTTRAALTGLRKRGYTLQKHRANGQPTVYRIVPGPSLASDGNAGSAAGALG